MVGDSGIQYTPVAEITTVHKRLYGTFHSHTTKPLEWRLQQLRKFYWAMKDNEQLLVQAEAKDMGKPAHEAYIAEVGWVQNDILYLIKNLPKWVKDEPAEDIDLMNKFFSPRIRKAPLGVILVIGAYNFPVLLSLGPMIGAIAAGNSVVLKPSESSPHTAVALEKVVREGLDPSAYTVVQGAIPETTELLNQKWDKICYTGGHTVGKIIAKKAAETLTPVILELGGKNPAIVTKNADIRLAARRLYWAKTFNAGQVCVSQNYIIIDQEVLPLFLLELKKVIKEFYPKGVRNSPDYGRIVNERSFLRLKKMLDDSKGKILLGGEMDQAELFIEPTVVQVDDPTDSMLLDESFGPLIPILPVRDLDEAIRIANEVSVTPLGIYPFGTTKETNRVLDETRSGGASVNDGFFHASIPTLSFGGVGESGYGAYHGRASFDAFTHRRSVTTTPGWIETALAVRYPPYGNKTSQFKLLNNKKPNFDRSGRVTTSIFGWLFGPKTLVALLVAIGIRQYTARQSKL